MEDEEFPDEFQCCVCLDIMYKPVVLACGHISCFWCVFKAMDTFQESHCPVCRNSYNHFPRICKLLHVLLLKLYPSTYKRKERQVAEEEKQYGHASPQCDGSLTESQFGDHSIIQENSKRTFPGEVNTTTIPTTSSSHTITNKANDVVEHSNQALVTDLQCAVCKNLLCRPVVLNCGHVYCEACIDPHDSVCKCPVCQSAHPNGFPSVCLVLEHFLEERFPEEYSARKESLRNFQSASPSGMPQGSTEKQEQVQCSPVPTNVCSTWFSDHGAKFHPGVGCDYCGMCPIIGLRYKCKDCVEKIGFDLCEGCYNSSSKLPGRFNQQHTQEHQFVVVRPHYLRNVILSLGAENLEEYDFVATNPSTPEEVLTVANLSNDALENELDSTASLNSSDEDSHGLEDSMTSPNSSNNRSEDHDCDFAR
ncbi:hypothetical protein DH2020_043438 [Rehmannia glutinosa]|uniref:E3 ubiquitin-protein ligase PRT1-like protein n=1 Tax=Rehmannia glutinosa TaxID=99300 RepID=A0ABR0UJN1_REHGL